MGWSYGDVIVLREIAWGRPWLAIPEIVVADTDDLLVTFIATGAPFGYAAGPWPTETGLHPWQPRTAWEGHGVLIMQRPDDPYAVWHFWHGEDRQFLSWYVNLQEPFRRTAIGVDTQDQELDVVVFPDGQWLLKDDEYMDQRVREGRYTAAEVGEIRAVGARITAMVDAGDTWWDPAYVAWTPDPSWATPVLPEGWEAVEVG
jgi:Protein of unknown function (DUF402)